MRCDSGVGFVMLSDLARIASHRRSESSKVLSDLSSIGLPSQKRDQLIDCQPYQAGGDDASDDHGHMINPLLILPGTI
jgi:hypothetical protein